MSIIGVLYALESEVFDRAGLPGRFLISAVRSVAHRRILALSIDKDGDYVNRQSEGVIVSPTPHRSDIRSVRSRVLDYWCVDYVPKSGDTILDVGAGIGEDTLVFAGQVGTGGRVYSLEANPTTARCLEKSILHSGLTQVEVIAAAVSDRPGKVAIADQGAHVRNSLLVAEGQHCVEVPAIVLDDFIESRGIAQVDLLKMNIEGAEQQALEGCRRTIGRVRHVAIACHDWIAALGHSEGYRTLAYAREFLATQGFILRQRIDDQRPWIRETLLGSRKGS